MIKKLLVILVILILYLLLFLALVPIFAQEAKVGEKLWISCPKNLAVFHILVILSPSGERMKGRLQHPLAQQAREYFQGFRDHPAVQTTDSLFKMMWYFVFNAVAFYYSELPEARLIGKIPAEYKEWRSMEKMMASYLASVRDFYRISGFEGFWKSHQKDIQSLINQVRDNLPPFDIPQLLEDFYGRKIDRFFIVPSPFMARSATHVEVQDDEGRWRFYHIDGGLGFSDSFSSAYYAFHEFSHCFIEPISIKYREEINKLAYLYEPLKKDLQSMGYKNWDRAFAEHMVTAAQIHLTRKAFGEDTAQEMLKKERKKGFKLIQHFYNYLKEYDENREEYKDLEFFYPKILSYLCRLNAEFQE